MRKMSGKDHVTSSSLLRKRVCAVGIVDAHLNWGKPTTKRNSDRPVWGEACTSACGTRGCAHNHFSRLGAVCGQACGVEFQLLFASTSKAAVFLCSRKLTWKIFCSFFFSH